MTAVMAQRDRLGEGDVRPHPTGNRCGHLGHLDRVGEARALVVGGIDDHLGLARQPPEGGGVDDAVLVALEAGAQCVGCLGAVPVPRAVGERRPLTQGGGLPLLTGDPVDDLARPYRCMAVAMWTHHLVAAQLVLMPGHGERPLPGAFRHVEVVHIVSHASSMAAATDIKRAPRTAQPPDTANSASDRSRSRPPRSSSQP